jgi:peroxiredoxin
MRRLAIAALPLVATSVAAQEAPVPPGYGLPPSDRPLTKVGDALPGFSLFDLHDRQARLQDVKEPVVVIVLWAFWCDTWIAALPQLRELAAEQGALDFRLVAVSVDGAWSDQLNVVCGEEELPFPVLIDRGSRLCRQLGLRRIPTVIIADQDRKITCIHEAYPGNPKVLEGIRGASR